MLGIPFPLLIKVASNTRPCSKLKYRVNNSHGGEEGGEYHTLQSDQHQFEVRKVGFSLDFLDILRLVVVPGYYRETPKRIHPG